MGRWRNSCRQCPVSVKKKSKKKGDSFTVYKTSGVYPEKGKPALPFTNRVVIDAGKLDTLSGLKTFRIKERINFTCSSQTFTVSRAAEQWFVSFTLDASKIPPIIHPVQKVGVDLGVKCLATVSDGTKYDMPATTKRAKIKLGLLQWRNRNKVLGNKKLGSGHVQPMKLSDRVFRCQACGQNQDRDENASINLENAPSDRVRLA
jgi:putative transposase